MENQSISAKKNTTSHKAKVTQGRSKPASKKADAQEKRKAVLDLPDLSIRSDFEKNDEFYSWETDGLIYEAMLSDPTCPKAFREAFTNIFLDHLFTQCEPTHPCHISAFFLLVVTSLQESIPADAVTAVNILRTLRETLAPELTEKILAALNGDGLEV
jgi:hypothetical protein